MRKTTFTKPVRIDTPIGVAEFVDHYPAKGKSKRWREYVIHLGALTGDKPIAFTSPESRATYFQLQGA